jgi:hypothetical protein
MTLLFEVDVAETATNVPLPYVTEYQVLFAALVLAVQVTPSGEVMTRLFEPSEDTATKRPFPYVIDFHEFATAAVDVAHVMPLFFPPAFRLIIIFVILLVLVEVLSVKESLNVAAPPGPIVVDVASVPSPKVTTVPTGPVEVEVVDGVVVGEPRGDKPDE